MAINPQLPFLDLNSAAAPERAVGARKSAASAGGSDLGAGFSQVLSQQMREPQRPLSRVPQPKPAEATSARPQETGPVERREATSRAPARKAEDRREASPETRPHSERQEPAPTANAKGNDSKPASEVDTEEAAEEGTTLPASAEGLPLFALQPLAAPGGADTPLAVDPGLGGGLLRGNLMQTLTQGGEAGSGELDAEGLDLADLGLDIGKLDTMPKLKTLEQLTALAGKSPALDGKLFLLNQQGPQDDFRGTLNAVSSTTSLLRETAPLGQYATSVQVPFQDPKWGEQMMNKVVWLTSQNLRAAEIHLNPADLGPIDVKIQVQQDQASIQIQAHNAGVREALEVNVHRLRETLAGNGLGLAQFDVSTQSGQQQARDQQQSGTGGAVGSTTGDDGESPVVDGGLEARVESIGLVNTYV